MNAQPEQPPRPAETKKRNPILSTLAVLSVAALLLFVGKQLSDRYFIPDVPGVVLTDLHSIDDLRLRFNQDIGTPRLVLLLSPT